MGLQDAQLAARGPARALGAGEAVPGVGEGDEARAPAVAVGGEHRADAAVAVGVGADDDVVLRMPSSIASRVRRGRQSMARRRSSIGVRVRDIGFPAFPRSAQATPWRSRRQGELLLLKGLLQ